MSLIYFVQRGEEGPIKIGFTAGSPEKRIGALQTACAERLHLRALLPGTRPVETCFHRRFSPWRLEGEWFRPVPLLTGFIRSLAEGGEHARDLLRAVDAYLDCRSRGGYCNGRQVADWHALGLLSAERPDLLAPPSPWARRLSVHQTEAA